MTAGSDESCSADGVWQVGQTFSLTADNKQLEARCFGPPPSQAPSIVLLHEGLGCVALWREFPERLAEATDFGVLAYSRAGYGASDVVTLPRPLDYMLHEAVTVLPEVLNSAGIQRCVLLGHSDGASIAALHGGHIADPRVRALVLMAPHFFTEPEALESIRQAGIAYDEGDLRARLARYHDNVDVAFRGWNDAWLHPDFKSWNIEDSIDYLRIPVLAIQGKQDQYGSQAQIDSLEQRLYSPFEKSMLDNCAHAPHLERTEETLSVVVDFLDRLERFERTG